MPVAYSTDLRTRVIEAWKSKEGTQAQLAERFKVSLSFQLVAGFPSRVNLSESL
jgi:hypothetical protein